MPLPNNYAGSQRVNARSNRVINLSTIYHQAWVDPATIVTNGVSVSAAGPNTTSMDAVIVGGKVVFDYPRNVVITVTHGSAVVALSGVISGLDLDLKPMTEAWSVTAGGTTKTFTGKKAFKIVTGVTVVAVADASLDSVVIGNGKVLGLDVKAAAPQITLLKEYENGAAPTAGVLVAGSSAATDDPRGTYTPNSALNGALDFDIYFMTDDPWNS